MHPAFSVIFFTTASGAGYGLLALLCALGGFGLVPVERWFGLAAFGIAFGLITAGLLSSTFHLGHPERAWRALTQWRSSWLSREGVMAIAAYVPTGAFALVWLSEVDIGAAFAALGVAGAVFCAVTVYCTAMIYGSLRAIPRWSGPWVVPGYLSLALATGALLLTLLLRLFGYQHELVDIVSVLALVVAGGIKWAYWNSIFGGAERSTVSSATGLGQSRRVRLLDAPHTESNYLLQEMGYRVARKHADRLRRMAIAGLFVGPLALLLAAALVGDVPLSTAFVGMAALSAALGVLVERWLFFAEAKHVVTLYYGNESA